MMNHECVSKKKRHGIRRVGSYEWNYRILWNRKFGGYVRLQNGRKDWKVEVMRKSC